MLTSISIAEKVNMQLCFSYFVCCSRPKKDVSLSRSLQVSACRKSFETGVHQVVSMEAEINPQEPHAF